MVTSAFEWLHKTKCNPPLFPVAVLFKASDHGRSYTVLKLQNGQLEIQLSVRADWIEQGRFATQGWL